MAKKKEEKTKSEEQNEQIKAVEEEEKPAAEQEGEEEPSFEELGLDPRLIRALNKKNIHKPTPIQLAAIPYILVILLFKFWIFLLHYHQN